MKKGERVMGGVLDMFWLPLLTVIQNKTRPQLSFTYSIFINCIFLLIGWLGWAKLNENNDIISWETLSWSSSFAELGNIPTIIDNVQE